MDPVILLDHLVLANKHVAEGEEHLAQQSALIADLRRNGCSTDDAEKLLRAFQEAQETFVAERDRIRRELATANPE